MDKIMLYGLNQQEVNSIQTCGLKCEVFEAEDYQDLIAFYADLTIADLSVLEDEEKNCLLEFYREIDPVDEKVILISVEDNFKNISFVDMIPELFDDSERVSVILMKYLKETRRDVEYSRRIMLTIKILHLISQNPGITTRELAEQVEISERSVRRYIRSMQAAGILLDFKSRGWYALADFRELL